jgi:hypothetical protein
MRMDAIVILCGNRGVAVEELDQKAREAVSRKDAVFFEKRCSPSVWVKNENGKMRVTMSYNQGIGRTCWRVTFDESGEIVSAEKARVTDRVE